MGSDPWRTFSRSCISVVHVPCQLLPNPPASCPSPSRTKLCHHLDGRRMMEKSTGQGKHPDPGSLLYVLQGVTNPLCKQSGQTSRNKLTFELPDINWGRYSRSWKDYWPQCLASRPHFFLSLFVWRLYWRMLWYKSRAFMQMLWCRVCGGVLQISQGWGKY